MKNIKKKTILDFKNPSIGKNLFNLKPGTSIRFIFNASISFLYFDHSPTTSIIETFNDFL